MQKEAEAEEMVGTLPAGDGKPAAAVAAAAAARARVGEVVEG